jgi:hypothetical protein
MRSLNDCLVDPGLGHTASDSFFRALHDDPRWLPFVKKMGFA